MKPKAGCGFFQRTLLTNRKFSIVTLLYVVIRYGTIISFKEHRDRIAMLSHLEKTGFLCVMVSVHNALALSNTDELFQLPKECNIAEE